MQSIKGVPVTQSQAEVYSVLSKHGPLGDEALVPLVQIVSEAPSKSPSGIRSRRHELVQLGLVDEERRYTRPSGGRAISIFEVV